MDREYDDTQRLIELYVQGTLGSDEAAEFEEFFMDRPDILAEIEAHRALKETLPHVLGDSAAATEDTGEDRVCGAPSEAGKSGKKSS